MKTDDLNLQYYGRNDNFQAILQGKNHVYPIRFLDKAHIQHTPATLLGSFEYFSDGLRTSIVSFNSLLQIASQSQDGYHSQDPDCQSEPARHFISLN